MLVLNQTIKSYKDDLGKVMIKTKIESENITKQN
jgi:hypothetical protein